MSTNRNCRISFYSFDTEISLIKKNKTVELCINDSLTKMSPEDICAIFYEAINLFMCLYKKHFLIELMRIVQNILYYLKFRYFRESHFPGYNQINTE